MTETYNHDDDDDDDDAPTLQRVAPTSSKIAVASASREPLFDAFHEEATTATDLGTIGDARNFDEIDTQKMPVEVRAGLVRASQVDDGA